MRLHSCQLGVDFHRGLTRLDQAIPGAMDPGQLDSNRMSASRSRLYGGVGTGWKPPPKAGPCQTMICTFFDRPRTTAATCRTQGDGVSQRGLGGLERPPAGSRAARAVLEKTCHFDRVSTLLFVPILLAILGPYVTSREAWKCQNCAIGMDQIGT